MARCKIYGTTKDDYSKVDSCFNVRAKDNMPVPQSNATRNIVLTGQENPALLQAIYMPTNKSSHTPVSCFDWDRAKIYFDAVDPSGKTSEFYAKQKDTNYQLFCGASKAYYVDGTLISGPSPYDNNKVYSVGDQVTMNGRTYKMVEAAGAAGYSPERPGDKLWSITGGPTLSSIVSASYGMNCNKALEGNRTNYISSMCPTGKTGCNFLYDWQKSGGDPAGGCGKTLVIKYKCTGSDDIKTFTVPPEAGFNGKVNLTC